MDSRLGILPTPNTSEPQAGSRLGILQETPGVLQTKATPAVLQSEATPGMLQMKAASGMLQA